MNSQPWQFIGGPSDKYRPPQTPDGWRWVLLSTVAKLESGHTPDRKKPAYWDGPIRWVSLQDTARLDLDAISETAFTVTDAGIENSSARVLPAGTVIFSRTATVGKSTILANDMATSQDFANWICGDTLLNVYLMHVLRGMERTWSSLMAGSTHNTIYMPDFRRLHILLPPVQEQRIIATLISAWDRGIRQLSDLIAAKLRFKQGLMQQLLTGTRRFLSCNGSPASPTQLQEVFGKVAVPLTLDPDTKYREIGIRSHGKGIFHKEPVLGRSLGNKRVYPVIPGCLTLNIVFAWERALAVTTEKEAGMIASHRFPMFRPNRDRVLPEYALHYLLSKRGTEALQLASPGGAGRNRTLSQTEFLKASLPLPPIAEQRRIVDFVETVDREIDLLKKQLDALKKQKKGLMQKLLTGQIRVRI